MEHGEGNLLIDQPLDNGDRVEDEVYDAPAETSVNGVAYHSSKSRQDKMDGAAGTDDDNSVVHFLFRLLHREILVQFQNRSNFLQLCLLHAFFLRC